MDLMKDLEQKSDPPAKKTKRQLWNNDDDELFLNCWENHQPELRKCKRNSHVFAKMAAEMGEKFLPEDIKIKIKNFTQRYRKEKKEVGPSGGSPSQFRYYNRVHKIIGCYAANNSTVEESVVYEILLDDLEVVDEEYSPTPSEVTLPLTSTSSSETLPASDSSISASTSNGLISSSRKRKRASKDCLTEIKNQGQEHLALFRQSIESNKAVSEEIVTLLREQREFDSQMINIMQKLVDKI